MTIKVANKEVIIDKSRVYDRDYVKSVIEKMGLSLKEKVIIFREIFLIS